MSVMTVYYSHCMAYIRGALLLIPDCTISNTVMNLAIYVHFWNVYYCVALIVVTLTFISSKSLHLFTFQI